MESSRCTTLTLPHFLVERLIKSQNYKNRVTHLCDDTPSSSSETLIFSLFVAHDRVNVLITCHVRMSLAACNDCSTAKTECPVMQDCRKDLRDSFGEARLSEDPEKGGNKRYDSVCLFMHAYVNQQSSLG